MVISRCINKFTLPMIVQKTFYLKEKKVSGLTEILLQIRIQGRKLDKYLFIVYNIVNYKKGWKKMLQNITKVALKTLVFSVMCGIVFVAMVAKNTELLKEGVVHGDVAAFLVASLFMMTWFFGLNWLLRRISHKTIGYVWKAEGTALLFLLCIGIYILM